ncbi:MAG: transcription termination factor Rho [Armatimonadetes bacterium]|nr:transcription termination factor Rho [Armatimonadota bacterium]
MSPPRRSRQSVVDEDVALEPVFESEVEEPEPEPEPAPAEEPVEELPRVSVRPKGLAYPELVGKTPAELREIGAGLGVPEVQALKKQDLLMNILLASRGDDDGLQRRYGILDVLPDNRGYLRSGSYTSDPRTDVYVAETQIRRFNLRTGDTVSGPVRPPKENERYHSLLRVETINGFEPDRLRRRPIFEDLTPVYPNERLYLETNHPHNVTGRFMDIITPIGKGQRGLIIAAPKAGKTTIIKQVANCLTENYPSLRLMVLLVDERPEEVTDIARSVDGEVAASTFDEMPEHHMKVSDLVLARAKRLVEMGEDVVILLDSITRLARASNLTVNPSGRTLSGGLDPSALHRPKRFFGAARNIEDGGSLTILATILVDTGSRMDDMIYEEFKATGNMDLVLARELSERGIFPAIDIQRSNTRHQELLFTDEEMQSIWQVRRALHSLDTENATETLIAGIRKTRGNSEFLAMAVESFAR